MSRLARYGLMMVGLLLASPVFGDEPLVFLTQGPLVDKARALYDETFKFGDEPPLHVAAVDLNGDQLNELVVFVDSRGFCPSERNTDFCTPIVFLNKALGGWESLMFEQGPSIGSWGDWSILDETMNGYRMLVGPESSGLVRYGWIGDRYVPIGLAKASKTKSKAR